MRRRRVDVEVSERLGEAKESLPPGVEPVMGPIATGLGEIYMYTVEYVKPHGTGAAFAPGKPGWQREGVYLTPEGRTLTSDLELASYLREVQDWIIRPQLKGVKDVAGVEAIGGYVKQYHIQPDPMKLVSYGLSFAEVIDAIEKNNISTGAGYVEHKGESYLVRATGRIEKPEQIAEIVVASRGGVPIRVKDIVQDGGGGIGIGRELRTGSASENGEEVVVATTIMLLGANSRTVAASVDAKMAEVQRSLPPGINAKTVLNRTKLVDATIATVQKNLLEGAVLVIVQQCEEVDQIESRAAEVMRQAITRLFENEGDEAAAWHAMKMRGFYFMQEAVLDHCKRAARTLEEILLENA